MSGVIRQKNQNKIPTAYLPLQLMITPNTVWNKCFLEESQNSREAQAFLKILKEILGQKKRNPLPTAVIGQSVVLKKEIHSNHSEKNHSLESESMGHSVSIGKNIYKFGFANLEVEDLIEPVQMFARRVGDEKIALAENISMALNDKAKKISFAELEQICGIHTAIKEQKDLLDILDEKEQLTIAGEININGDLFIVETDFTAAMMFGYIQHLEKHLVEIMGSERIDTALDLLASYLYLFQAFKRLNPKTQQQGKRLSKEIEFPFPPLN